MQKIRSAVLEKLESARLTNKELMLFLHICRYQSDDGTVCGVYYKDMCSALGMSYQSFYTSLYKLRDCGLIGLTKANRIDWDIQILENDCRDLDIVKKEGYLSVADGMFGSVKFQVLKANEKLMAMRLLVYCRSGERTYKQKKDGFIDHMRSLLGCGVRAVKKYLTALKGLFCIGIKDGMYLITIRREIVARPLDVPSDALLENQQKARSTCNRNRIAMTEATLNDTARLAIQYKVDISAMEKNNDGFTKVFPDGVFSFDWLIGKAMPGLGGKLNPKYIHTVLRNEIEKFYVKLAKERHF